MVVFQAGVRTSGNWQTGIGDIFPQTFNPNIA